MNNTINNMSKLSVIFRKGSSTTRQSEAKNLGNIHFMLPRFFTTLRSVLNDNLGIFYRFSINFSRFSLHYSKLSLPLRYR